MRKAIARLLSSLFVCETTSTATLCGSLCVLVTLTLSACSSAPKKQAGRQLIPVDQEAEIGMQLDRKLDTAFGAWRDATVDKIVGGIIDRLVAADPAYAEARGARVHLLATATPYVAPGLRKTIYLSRGALSLLRYENELAFVLATQLELVKEHATAKNLADLQGQEVGEYIAKLPVASSLPQRDYLASGWFEPGGLFDLGSMVYINAEQAGVRLAYAAKYDPRGAVTLIERWNAPPFDRQLKALGKIQPKAEERLNNARDEVAKLSPMRNPIVKSLSFEELQSRVQVKKAKAKVNTTTKQVKPKS